MNGSMPPGRTSAAAGAQVAPYDRLRLCDDQEEAEAQVDILRLLEGADVPESQRESVRELQRLHLAQYLLRRRDQRRDDVERISERRSQVRARGRDNWRAPRAEDVITIELVQSRFSGLYPQPAQSSRSPAVPTKSTSIGDPSLSRSTQHTQRPPMDTRDRVQTTSAMEPALPPTAPQLPRPATLAPQHEPVSSSLRALSDLLKKKSGEPGEDDNEAMQYPRRQQPKNYRAEPHGRNPFQTAGEKLQKDHTSGSTFDDYDDDGMDRFKRNGRGLARGGARTCSYHPVNPQLLFGADASTGDDELDSSGAIRKKFVSPVVRPGEERYTAKPTAQHSKLGGTTSTEEEEDIDPRLKSCDPELISKIEMEIVDNGDPVTFDDIAGLQFAKKCVNELVIWPMARPDIFTGLRALPKGLLLFGPPGTGKTLIGKAIASQSGATFFSISASSLTSKWIGEGEKLVRTLFAVAAVKQPSVIFIDEIDSLLTQRSSEENEASRRMKTEFLVQLDGAGTKAKDVILVVGATNRPQELDEAARRRFVKRLYIPLPSYEARLDLMNRLLKGNRHGLSEQDLKEVAEKTAGYSGADVRALCTEAAMGPIRSCVDIQTMDADSVRPINLEDFNEALKGVRSSVAAKDLDFYKAWNDEFGSFAFVGHEG